jgi:RNA polymerase primary sigma factor
VEPNEKSEKLKQLLITGKTKGYVLFDEIDEILPPTSERYTELDIILSELARNAIDVVGESRTGYEKDFTERDNSLSEKELQNLSEEPNGTQMVMYLREALVMPRLTREDERQLATRIQDGEDALKRLIEANLYLVVATAKRHSRAAHDLLELIQEGNVGLMIAAKNFSQKREYGFSTYATLYIRWAIAQFSPLSEPSPD